MTISLGVRLIVLSEFSVLRVLWSALVQPHPFAMFSVMPILPFLATPLNRLAQLLKRHGWMVDATDAIPGSGKADSSAIGLAIADVYPRCEDAVMRHFRLTELSARVGHRYRQAYRHAAMGFLKSRMQALLVLGKIESHMIACGATLHCIHPEMVALFHAVHGHKPQFSYTTVTEVRRLANFLLAMAALIAALSAAVHVIRLKAKSNKPMALGYDQADADATGSAAGLALNILGPAGILFFFRNRAQADAAQPDDWRGRELVRPDEGELGIRDVARVLGGACADIIGLLGSLGAVHPHLFFAMVKLPVKRISLRSILARHPVKAFLARDDYNTEHIIRSQELRRIGAVSMGITHGMPTAPVKMMHWQYLDLDRYYTFGIFPYDTYYRPYWAPGMCARAIGAWGMSTDQRCRLNLPRTSDIVYFANPLSDPMPLLRAAIAVAAAFPDRLVWVKIKNDYKDAEPKFYRYLRMATHRLGNIRITYENPYELILRCRFAISGLTTVVAEAAQFGCVSLFLDFYEPGIDVLFRQFPEICVDSAAGAIERIRAVESGKWSYPKDHLNSLIAMQCSDPFSVIASDSPRADLAGQTA